MPSTSQDAVSAVCRSMVVAAHRRDHEHSRSTACHPHVVEVVHLGHRALAVCHDCATDTGLVDEREAELAALAHRHDTAADDVPLVTRVPRQRVG